MFTVFLHEYVTGGGLADSPPPRHWTSEGGAMRRALARDFAAVPEVRVVMTLDHRLPDEPGPWSTVRVGPGEEWPTLGRLAAEADGTLLVAPETGGLHRDRAVLMETVGGRSLGSSPEAIGRSSDKASLGESLRAWGIASPWSRRVEPAAELPRDFEYPAVLKPNDGAGSIDTYVVEGPGAWPAGASERRNAILQPFVTGTPMSVAALRGSDGSTRVLGVSRQRMVREGDSLAYRGGRFEGPGPEVLDRIVGEIGRRLRGLRGCFGVDYVWREATQEAVVLEVNPRPTTSYVALVEHFGPGGVARAWLAAVAPPSWNFEVAGGVPKVARAWPIGFEADGTIHPGPELGQP